MHAESQGGRAGGSRSADNRGRRRRATTTTAWEGPAVRAGSTRWAETEGAVPASFFSLFFFFPREQGASRRSSSCASRRAAGGRSNRRPPSWLGGGGGGGRFRLTSAFSRGCSPAAAARRCAEVELGVLLKNPVRAPHCCRPLLPGGLGARSPRPHQRLAEGSCLLRAPLPVVWKEGHLPLEGRITKEVLVLFFCNTWTS